MPPHVLNRPPPRNISHKARLADQMQHILAQPLVPVLREMRIARQDVVAVVERNGAGEQLDEEYAEAPYIHGSIEDGVVAEALRGHVDGRPAEPFHVVEVLSRRKAEIVLDGVAEVDKLHLQRRDVS